MRSKWLTAALLLALFPPGAARSSGRGIEDCNNNGVPDSRDIADGTSQDANGNKVPDECDALPRFRIVDIGAILDTSSWGQGINELNEVAGYSLFCCPDDPKPGTGTLFLSHGVFWLDGVLTDLGAVEFGAPPCSPVGCQSQALDLNSLGWIVGRNEGFAGFHPVVWVPGPVGDLSAGVNLLPVPPGFMGGVALDINDAKQIVGFIGTTLTRRAALWEFDGTRYTVTDLGTLRSDGTGFASATGINEEGQIVGTSASDSGVAEPFLWLPTPAFGLPAGMTSLDPGTDQFGGGPTDINAAGQVLGSIGSLPWLWLPQPAFGFPAGLSMIPLGDFGVLPSEINNHGQIVGTAFVQEQPNGPVFSLGILWHEGTWFFLNDVVVNGKDWNITNFSLQSGINDAGWITGDGSHFKGDVKSGNRVSKHRGYVLIPDAGP